MNRPRLLCALFAVFLLNMPVALAQRPGQAVREAYLSQSQSLSNIYNGRVAEIYPNTFSGSYYLYSRLFIEGSLFYNGKYYHKVELNINAHKDELYILSPDKS